jgi:hypothetical protein
LRILLLGYHALGQFTDALDDKLGEALGDDFLLGFRFAFLTESAPASSEERKRPDEKHRCDGHYQLSTCWPPVVRCRRPRFLRPVR